MPRHVLNRVLAECCACTGARCKIIDRVVERIGRTPLVVRAFSDACRTRRVRVHRLAAASASCSRTPRPSLSSRGPCALDAHALLLPLCGRSAAAKPLLLDLDYVCYPAALLPCGSRAAASRAAPLPHAPLCAPSTPSRLCASHARAGALRPRRRGGRVSMAARAAAALVAAARHRSRLQEPRRSRQTSLIVSLLALRHACGMPWQWRVRVTRPRRAVQCTEASICS